MEQSERRKPEQQVAHGSTTRPGTKFLEATYNPRDTLGENMFRWLKKLLKKKNTSLLNSRSEQERFDVRSIQYDPKRYRRQRGQAPHRKD